MATERERIARLETQQHNMADDISVLANEFRQFRNDEFQEFKGEMRGSLERIEHRFTKMAGFFGGITFCVSGLWAAAIVFVNWLVKAGNTH